MAVVGVPTGSAVIWKPAAWANTNRMCRSGVFICAKRVSHGLCGAHFQKEEEHESRTGIT